MSTNVDPRRPVDPGRRFAPQTLHRPSQSLHAVQPAHQHYPLHPPQPFSAHSQSPPGSMIGPTAPAAPYDPNVFPSYPPPERHQQEYQSFTAQLLAGGGVTNPPNPPNAPPQAIYNDDVIGRMLQKDQHANSYPTAVAYAANGQAMLGGGGGYAMHNQNPYAAPVGIPYPNPAAGYSATQAQSGVISQSDPSLQLSPDSIHSIESPPLVLQQGPLRSQTMPLYGNISRPLGSPDTEVPFSQIVARNSPQNSWPASGSPTNPTYGHTGYFPLSASAAANDNSGMMSQQMQAGPPHMQQQGLAHPPIVQQRPSNGNLRQADGRTASAPTGPQNRSFVENISGRKMAPAVSRRDPQQRIVDPQVVTSRQQQLQPPQKQQQQQLLQPGSLLDAGGRSVGSASGTSRGGGSQSGNKRKKIIDPDSSSEEEEPTAAPPARLPGACGPCKKLKMRCEFKDGEDACRRCKNSGRGHLCIVGPRKPRQPSNKKDMLMQKLKEKDAVIESLLKQLHNPHLLTPLSVDPARISPSLSSRDENQLAPHIVEWIEKAQASIKHNGGTTIGGYRVFDAEDSSSESDDGNELTSPKYGFGRASRVSSGSAEHQSSDKSGYSGPLGPNGVENGVETMSRRTSSPKLHSLPMDNTPIGMLADLSLKESEGKRSRAASAIDAGEIPQPDPEEDNELGVARKDYFQPGPAAHLGLRKIIIERKNVPEIMTTGLITPAEVEKLFDIFFKKMNLFVSILDENIHTPATTFGRCPFLFTVVCAVSSRYYTERPELYSIAMHFAKLAAANALIDGWKSVEVCQAYILMSVYSLPSRKWEEAREWLYLGLAIRMATDLNLHLPSTTKVVNEQHERELLNRTRTWLICHNLDRSTSAQLGKPYTIHDDWIIRNSKEWWRRSKFNHPYDLHLVAYTDMLRNIMANFQKMVYSDPNSPNGLNKNLDFEAIAFSFDDQLQTWKSECAVRFATYSDSTSSQCAYRVQLLPFYVNYSRLVILSFAFHSGALKQSAPGDDVVMRCLDAASSVIKVIVEVHAKTEYLRYAPDGHFVFVSFASAFLIKMLRTDPVPLLDDEQRQRVIELIERLIETLRSKQVAVDERHAPMLYSRFLTTLLAKHKGSNTAPEEPKTEPNGQNTNPPSASKDNRPVPAPVERVSRHMRHESSPSIEIVPPQPDTADQDMQGFDNDFGAFDPTPNPLSHLNGSQQPQALPPSLATLGTFPSTSFDASNLSTATSTVHPGSTIHGSQFDDSMPINADDFMLAPMYAVQNDAFWQHGMMPGFSWGPVEIPWEMQMAVDPNDYTGMNMVQHQQQPH